MKVAIISDTHFGGRGDGPHLLKHQKKFFKEIFFPKLKEEGVDTVLHMGDLFDRRKFVNFETLRQTKEIILDPLVENGLTMHIVVGNHDVFYKNTNSTNSLSLLLKEYENIHVYVDDIKELTFGETNFVMVPWLNPENIGKIMRNLKKSSADVVLGHFEIEGFPMTGNEKCKHGLSRSDFKKFNKVLSGHFHVPSEIGNIQYIGAPYQMDWSDYGGSRGFYLMDCGDAKMEFVENTFSLFNVIEYDDSGASVDDLEELDPYIFENTYIRVQPTNVENKALFEKFINKIENMNAADVKVRELPVSKKIVMKIEDGEEVEEEEIDISDTETVISSYVENGNIDDGKKEAVKEKLLSLYKRCKK